MSKTSQCIAEFGIADEQMGVARAETQAYMDVYNPRKSHRARDMTQAKPDQAASASPDCVSLIWEMVLSALYIWMIGSARAFAMRF